MSSGKASPVQFWQDYAFITDEMYKFLLLDNYEMFFQLLEEREKLQQAIGDLDSGDFKQSLEGLKFYQDIRRKDSIMLMELTRRLNDVQKQEQLSNAYDVIKKGVGGQLDQKG